MVNANPKTIKDVSTYSIHFQGVPIGLINEMDTVTNRTAVTQVVSQNIVYESICIRGGVC